MSSDPTLNAVLAEIAPKTEALKRAPLVQKIKFAKKIGGSTISESAKPVARPTPIPRARKAAGSSEGSTKGELEHPLEKLDDILDDTSGTDTEEEDFFPPFQSNVPSEHKFSGRLFGTRKETQAEKNKRHTEEAKKLQEVRVTPPDENGSLRMEDDKDIVKTIVQFQSMATEPHVVRAIKGRTAIDKKPKKGSLRMGSALKRIFGSPRDYAISKDGTVDYKNVEVSVYNIHLAIPSISAFRNMVGPVGKLIISLYFTSQFDISKHDRIIFTEMLFRSLGPSDNSMIAHPIRYTHGRHENQDFTFIQKIPIEEELMTAFSSLYGYLAEKTVSKGIKLTKNPLDAFLDSKQIPRQIVTSILQNHSLAAVRGSPTLKNVSCVAKIYPSMMYTMIMSGISPFVPKYYQMFKYLIENETRK